MDFDVWCQNNEKDLIYTLQDIFKSFNSLNIPESFNIDFEFNDSVKSNILQYLYKNSSSALIRKS